PFSELASTFFIYFSFFYYLSDLHNHKNAIFFVIPEFHEANPSKKRRFRGINREVLAGSGGWFRVLSFNFQGYINGRTLLYIGPIIGPIHSWTPRTWQARLVSLSNHPRHVVHARAPIPAKM
ncbi:MAG: hypothetical protein IJQ83_01875, partial [Bacteroidales bacterium]|nr:hypothetical protein [Bacteroidales bacterium]